MRRPSSDGGALAAVVVVGIVVLAIAVKVAIIWCIASAVTSGAKAATGSCDKRYPVEAVLGGDWFCAEDE